MTHKFITLFLLLALTPAIAFAQEEPTVEESTEQPAGDDGLLKSPVFVFQGGGLAVNTLDSEVESATGFVNLRFLTFIPTATKWLTLASGVSFVPSGDFEGPAAFIFGGAIPVPGVHELTASYVDMFVIPGGYWTGDLFGSVELATFLNLGKAVADTGVVSKSSLYLLANQTVLGQDEFAFNPLMIFGLQVPLAPL